MRLHGPSIILVYYIPAVDHHVLAPMQEGYKSLQEILNQLQSKKKLWNSDKLHNKIEQFEEV